MLRSFFDPKWLSWGNLVSTRPIVQCDAELEKSFVQMYAEAGPPLRQYNFYNFNGMNSSKLWDIFCFKAVSTPLLFDHLLSVPPKCILNRAIKSLEAYTDLKSIRIFSRSLINVRQFSRCNFFNKTTIHIYLIKNQKYKTIRYCWNRNILLHAR